MKIVILNDNGDVPLPISFITKRTLVEAMGAEVEVMLVAGNPELVLQLRQRGFCNAIVYLTTDAKEAQGLEAIKQGADNYVVTDNLSEEDLQKTIESALAIHSMRCTSKRIEANLDLLSEL